MPPNRLSPAKWTLFRIANDIVFGAVYFPGLAVHTELMPRPTLTHFLAFLPVYVDNLLGSLVWLRDVNAFGLSNANSTNGAGASRSWPRPESPHRRAYDQLKTRDPEARIFLLFAAFALICGVATAGGCANVQDPTSSANSSHYSAALVLFALIFYYAAKLVLASCRSDFGKKLAVAVFLAISITGYIEAVKATRAPARLPWLASNYSLHAENTDIDQPMLPYRIILLPSS